MKQAFDIWKRELIDVIKQIENSTGNDGKILENSNRSRFTGFIPYQQMLNHVKRTGDPFRDTGNFLNNWT
jgi:hypothetical protein